MNLRLASGVRSNVNQSIINCDLPDIIRHFFEFKSAARVNKNLLTHQFSESSQDSILTTIPLPDLLQVADALEKEDPNSSLLSSTYLRIGQIYYQVVTNDRTVDHSIETALAKDYFQLGIKRLKANDFSGLADAFSNLAEVYFFKIIF